MAENSSSKTMIKNGTILLVLSRCCWWCSVRISSSSGTTLFWVGRSGKLFHDTTFLYTLCFPMPSAGHQPFTGCILWVGKFSDAASNFTGSFGFCFWSLLAIIPIGEFLSSQPKRSLDLFAAVILESVILTQLTLLTFEIFHIFLFLATLNALLKGRKALDYPLLLWINDGEFAGNDVRHWDCGICIFETNLHRPQIQIV